MIKEEEEDRFYDSLDETSELQETSPSEFRVPAEEGSTSCLFLSNVTDAQSCISNKVADDDGDVSSLIPLYGGEVQKSERRQSKKRVKRKPKTLEALEKKTDAKSYVALFHSRIGYPSERLKKAISDSARAVDGDLTQRTVGEEQVNNVAEVFEDAQYETADDTQR